MLRPKISLPAIRLPSLTQRSRAPPRAAPLPFLYRIGSRVSPSRGKPLTARLAGCRAGSHALAYARQVELPASSKHTFMNKKVSFADRVGLMQAAVQDLRAILEIVQDEAQAVAEAQQRFAAKKPTQKRPAKSTE